MDDMAPTFDSVEAIDGEEANDRADASVRTYVIPNPSHPLEAAGERVLKGNVLRSVDYSDNGNNPAAKFVTWRFDESTF